MSENNGENNIESISRRSLLKSSAGTAAGIAAFTGMVTETSAEEVPVQITELERGDRGRVLSRALSDRDVKLLKSEFVKNGWTPRISEATIVRTVDDANGVTYHTVQIPFETKSDGEQAHLLWGDIPAIKTQGRHYTHIEGITWNETSYWVDENSVQSTSTERDVDVPEADGVGIQAWCLPWKIHWGCVLVIAGAFATTYGSCGICVADPTRYTCIICVGAVLGGTGGIAMCTWCR
jgi:hypothetical protein